MRIAHNPQTGEYLGLRDGQWEKLRIAEKEAPKTIKIVGGDGGVPMDFAFWIQLHKVSDTDTRMRLVLHIELNMMMKMMIGGKLQGAIDQIAEGIARAMQAQA